MENLAQPAQSDCPTTIWSEVGRASACDDEVRLAALQSLLLKYYRPLQFHLQNRFCVDQDTAADWLHDFVHSKILLSDFLSRAARDRGRFRTYLLNAVDNFVISLLRKKAAKVRNPGGGLTTIEDPNIERLLARGGNPQEKFTQEWGRKVIDLATARMRAECEEKGCLGRWGLFEARLLGPMLDGAEVPKYEDLVAKFRFASPAEAQNTLATAKRQFDRLLRQVIAEYIGDPNAVEEEIRDLMRGLSS
jgi:RNA polymerase sigma-70 factor (ECF subfamily)